MFAVCVAAATITTRPAAVCRYDAVGVPSVTVCQHWIRSDAARLVSPQTPGTLLKSISTRVNVIQLPLVALCASSSSSAQRCYWAMPRRGEEREREDGMCGRIVGMTIDGFCRRHTSRVWKLCNIRGNYNITRYYLIRLCS